MMNKLNIGCGWNKKQSFVNIDKSKEVKPDLVVNIEEGLPFKNNNFNYIYSSHCLEHVRPDKWEFVLDEIMRVAKNGCVLEVVLPFDNIKKRTNIGHYRTFGYWSFSQYYDDEKERSYYKKWKLKPIKIDMFNPLFILLPILKKEIRFKFMVVK